MPRPQLTDYGSFSANYVNQTTDEDVQKLISNSYGPLKDFLGSIPESKAGFAYAPGKWTLKELLQHMIDTERIFSYRALCIARGEAQNLPGFDENEYATTAGYAVRRPWGELVDELLIIRKATIMLFNSFDETSLSRRGLSNHTQYTTNAFGFVIIGHVLHHQNIIRERYLSEYSG